jgi:hypothetical protein
MGRKGCADGGTSVTLDLSLTAVVDGASGMLLAIIGAGSLAFARDRRGRLMSLCVVAFGAWKVVDNFLRADSPSAQLVIDALAGATVLACGVLSVDLARGATKAQRAALAGAVLVMLMASGLVVARGYDVRGGPIGLLNGLENFLAALALVFVGASASVAFATEERRDHRIGLALLAFALAPWGLWQVVPYPTDLRNLELIGALTAAAIVSLLCWLIPVARGPDRRIARTVTLTFLGAALLMMTWNLGLKFAGLDPSRDYGVSGIIRTIGAVGLVFAIVKFDLLGAPLPKLVIRSGQAAGVFLALLLIVAQVAQNFLAAKYGLLLGGVIAGCFLFAASPVQRMIERRGERRVGVQPASSQSELVFKAAVRTAISEGPVTPAQERHLSEVAHHLGIGAMDMIRLKQEVETEGASVRVKEADS